MDFERHLSRAAKAMHASAIRKAGDVGLASGDVISLAPGYPDPALFAWNDFREIAASLLTGSDGTVLQYGATRGYKPLVEGLPHLLDHRGIRATPDEIIVTTGSQQALDLCARVFLDAGNVALVELPAYTGAMTSFWNAQGHLVGVQQDAAGIDMQDLDRVLARERAAGRRVAFVYVVPNFQNPTGLLMSLTRRAELLEWSASRDVLIVEDDPYGALYFDDVATAAETRPIKADDRDGHVVYLSSFSKTVAPGFRVAWITAAPDLVNRLEIAKQSADLCTSALDQRFVYEIWKRGVLESRLPRLRDAYRQKRTVLEQALHRELDGLVTWPEPKGGFFLWASFIGGIDTDALLQRAVDHGVVFVPGSAFYVEQRQSDRARLSFSAPTPDQIRTAVGRLAAAVRAELDARGSSRPEPASGSGGAPSAAPPVPSSG
jgi:2-aminoadipate transaminase